MRRVTILVLTVATAAVFAALASAGPTVHRHDMAKLGGTTSQALAAQLADARVATAKYANNLVLAKKQGYGVITQMIPDMGWHFLNPKVSGFNVTGLYSRRSPSLYHSVCFIQFASSRPSGAFGSSAGFS